MRVPFGPQGLGGIRQGRGKATEGSRTPEASREADRCSRLAVRRPPPETSQLATLADPIAHQLRVGTDRQAY